LINHITRIRVELSSPCESSSIWASTRVFGGDIDNEHSSTAAASVLQVLVASLGVPPLATRGAVESHIPPVVAAVGGCSRKASWELRCATGWDINFFHDFVEAEVDHTLYMNNT